MKIQPNTADSLLDTIVQLSLSLFSEGETVLGQTVIEDVEENVPENGVNSDFLPNMVRKVIFFSPCAVVGL